MIEDRYLHLFIEETLFRVEEAPTLAPNKKEHHALAVLTKPMSDIQKVLLGKILAAVSLQLDQTKIIYSLEDLNFSFDRLLVFGTETGDELGVTETYSPKKHELGAVMLANTLSELEASRELKGSLWSALQDWFGI